MRSSAKALAEFNGAMASAVERSLPLEIALDLLADQASGRRMKEALSAAAGRVREGMPLPEALGRNPDLFPADYCARIKAGLEAGVLAEILRSCQAEAEFRDRMGRQIRKVLSYFAVTGAFCIIAVLSYGSIAGSYFDVLEGNLRIPLPRVTRSVAWLVRHPAASALLSVLPMLLAAGILQAFRKSVLGGRFAYLLPVWGPLQKSRDLAVFVSTLALSLRAGMSLPAALTSAAEALRNRHARSQIERVRLRLAEGESLSSALYYVAFFPKTLAWAVSLGEERNELPGTLERFARLYAADQERHFEIAYQLLTPLGYLVLGNGVLWGAFAVVLPIAMTFDILGGRKR